MANEEGVKIVISAEDRFSETMKKIDASSKIFGETTKNTQRHLEALEKEMIRLVANGLTPADEKIKQMKADYDRLKESLDNGDSSLKKSNQQWTNLALVVQDLPYGFRGIQNNLPALIGGIAGVSGAVYFLGSVLIATWTAYGDKITQAIFQTSAFEKANKDLVDGMINAAKSTSTAREELFKVSAVIKAGKDNLIDKSAALAYYNKILGTTFGAVSSLDEAESKIREKTPKYIEALGLKAKAEYYYAKSSEYAAKGDIAKLEDQTTIFDKLISISKGFANIETLGPKDIIKNVLTAYSEAQTSAVDKISKNSKIIGDILYKAGKDAMDKYFEALNSAQLTDKEIQDIFKQFNNLTNKSLLKSNEYLEKQAKAEFEYYKNNLFQAEYYFNKLNNIEKENAITRAKIEGASKEDIKNIQKTYEQNSLNFHNEIENKKFAIRQQSFERSKKLTEQYQKDEENSAQKANDRNLQNSLDALKIQSDVETKLLLKGGKSNASARIKILENYKNSLYDLASVGGYTAEQFDKIDDALIRVDAAIEASGDKLKNFDVSWTDALNGINTAIRDFINNSMVALGESIGKALAGENVDLINTFGALLADALQAIGKQLIALSTAVLFAWTLLKNPNPVNAGLALAAGIAAVAIGSYLKSKLSQDQTKNTKEVPKFANGGIVSGPTMGLIGEYPGAKSNPEVVAPLDKLKDMIGGQGGGQFVLRGNDLVLALTRSETSLNLRRGA